MYSNTEQARHEHNGIVKWLDEVLAGILENNYEGQAKELLGSSKPETLNAAAGEGTGWMEADGLED